MKTDEGLEKQGENNPEWLKQKKKKRKKAGLCWNMSRKWMVFQLLATRQEQWQNFFLFAWETIAQTALLARSGTHGDRETQREWERKRVKEMHGAQQGLVSISMLNNPTVFVSWPLAHTWKREECLGVCAHMHMLVTKKRQTCLSDCKRKIKGSELCCVCYRQRESLSSKRENISNITILLFTPSFAL